MPSIHISESDFEPYVLEHGSFEVAKEAIKEVVHEHAPEPEPEANDVGR